MQQQEQAVKQEVRVDEVLVLNSCLFPWSNVLNKEMKAVNPVTVPLPSILITNANPHLFAYLGQTPTHICDMGIFP